MTKKSSMYNLPIVICAVILLITLLIFLAKEPQHIHAHAAFVIYENNIMKDFSKPEFMFLAPCGNANLTANSPEERAHLHNNNGKIVHIHQSNATWGDLFVTLNINLKNPVIYYINNRQIDDVINTIINPYDRLAVFIGETTETESKLNTVPEKNEIEVAEKISEYCSK